MNKMSLPMAYAMKKKQQKKAMGGELESGYESMPVDHEEMNHAADMEDDEDINHKMAMGGDLVDRIMMKRKNFAKGGVVADEPGEKADEMSADYDYLSTGDLDDHTTNSGAADGDELGNHQEDEDRHDIVSRIMKSRAKRDRMPSPA